MDCLVTKLRTSVADDSLRVLGEFRFAKRNDVPATVDNLYTVIYSPDSDVTVTILNDGYFCKANSTERDTSLGKSIVCKAGVQASLYISLGSEVRVTPKYGIEKLQIISSKLDLSEFGFMDNIKTLLINDEGVTGSVESFENAKLTSINLAGSNYQVYGNLEKIKDFTALTSINIGISRVTGDIAYCFGKSIALNTLSVANSDVSGSIEALVAAQIAAGRATGTIKLPYAKDCLYITYEGIPLFNNANIPAHSANNQFSWTADGTITWS